MFDCGISIITKEIQAQFDNDCLTVIQEYGFNIDKDRLRKAITDSRSFYDEGYRDAKRMFERPQGEWVDVNGDGSLWKCSNCGEQSCCRGKYCSDCGAKMKEADNDKSL